MTGLHIILGVLFGAGFGMAAILREYPLMLLFGGLIAINVTMQAVGI